MRHCGGAGDNCFSCVVVLLTEVEQLTKNAQHALRRTMEKYTKSCRLILSCNSTSKVIPAIHSRCLGVRVPAPAIQEVQAHTSLVIHPVQCRLQSSCAMQITMILQQVCKKEGLSLPPELAQRVAEKSNRNLRKALLLCEACRVQQ